MGKKTKKTKWRTLEISLPVAGKNYRENGANVRWDEGWRVPSHKYRRSAGGGCDKMLGTSSTSNVDLENPSKEHRAKTLLEDEYTKITTPRQDVLFKKGYLTKRKASRHMTGENMAANVSTNGAGAINLCITQQDCANNGDQEYCDYANIVTDVGGDDVPQLVCATAQPYMNASSAAAAIYYGGGYEIYDPYTGSVTALVVGAASSSSNGATTAAACQPILTSMPCRPVPLQSLQWFNPVPSSSEWCCGAYTQQSDANGSSSGAVVAVPAPAAAAAAATDTDDICAHPSYFDDSTNMNGPTSESSCIAESTTPTTGDDSPIYPHTPQSYLYPSCVFATPVYDVEEDGGGNTIRYDSPASPISSANQSAATKRKKKRKRRRRLGDTEDDSESGVEDYADGCVAGNEYVCDYVYDNEYDHDHDHDHDHNGAVVSPRASHACQTAYQHRRKCTATLPRASINAPPFVPCDRVRSFREPQPDENYAGNVDVESPAAAAADANVGSSKHYASLADSQTKSLTDSPSSCSNSDSGISSPTSEDCSSKAAEHPEFRKSTKAADRPKNVDDNLNVNGTAAELINDNSSSANGPAADVVAAAAAALIAPNANVDGGAGSYSVRTNSGKYDKLAKKMRVKNCTGTRVAVAKLPPPRSKNEERDGRSEVARASDDDDDDDECMLDDLLDGNRDENIRNVELGVVASRASEENCRKNLSKMNAVVASPTERTNAAIVVAGSDRPTTDCHQRPPQRSFQQSNAAETRWSNASRNDDIDASGCECEKALAGPTCNGEVSRNDENDSSRPSTFGWTRLDCIDNAQSANPISNADQRWQRAVSAASGPPIRLDENSYGDSNANAEEKTSADVNAAVESCRVGLDAASSPSPSSSTLISYFPSYRRERADDSRECVALAARALVEEIAQQAELRIRARTAMTTKKCDKLRLPLTQAVTNWLNEHGGLSSVIGDSSNDHRYFLTRQRVQDSSDSRPLDVRSERQSRSKTRKRLENPIASSPSPSPPPPPPPLSSSSNCVIC